MARSLLLLGLFVATAFAADPACDGIKPTSRQQFCCGGIIYYDPNFLYTCCDGRVCPVDGSNNVVIQPQPPQPQPAPQPQPPAPSVIYQPSVNKAPMPAPVPIVASPQQPSSSSQQPAGWNPFFNPFFFNYFEQQPQQSQQPQLAVVPKVPTAPEQTIYCDGVDLSKLQKVQPTLACCGNTVVYDSRYYTCGASGNQPSPPQQQLPQQQQQPILPPVPAQAPQVSLPTAFVPVVCEQNLYYIDPRISNFYKCCSSNVYDSRSETCQQAYRLLYQPTDTYRVMQLDPNVQPQRSILTCGATKYIFASSDMASRYSC